MKRLLVSAALLVAGLACTVSAENNYTSPRLEFGLRGGMAISNGGVSQYDWCYMPTLGITFAHRLCELPLYIETGIWANAFIHNDLDWYSYSDDWEFGIAVKLPVLVNYHFKVGRDMAVTPFLGPYFAVTDEYDTTSLRNFDCGLRTGCAFNWKKLYTNIGFDFGFLDRQAYTSGSHTVGIGNTCMIYWTIGANLISK